MNNEMIEIYNPDMKLIGVKKRKDVHKNGAWHRGVHAFFFNDKRELLVQKRSSNCDTFPNAYDCSVSEHVSIGETYIEALQRGTLEELSIKVECFNKLVSYRMSYGLTDNMLCELYEAQINENEILINQEEILSIEFVSLEELKTRIGLYPNDFTSWFKEQLLFYFDSQSRLEVIDKEIKMSLGIFEAKKNYEICYPDPLSLKIGEFVTIIRSEEDSSEWYGWHFCKDQNLKEGWVSVDFMTIDNNIGKITNDYSAKELCINKGQDVIVLEESCGWYWCSVNCDNGWVPKNIFDEL